MKMRTFILKKVLFKGPPVYSVLNIRGVEMLGLELCPFSFSCYHVTGCMNGVKNQPLILSLNKK